MNNAKLPKNSINYLCFDINRLNFVIIALEAGSTWTAIVQVLMKGISCVLTASIFTKPARTPFE